MTHRRTREVCAACHPSVSKAVRSERPSERPIADGGTHAACPVCSGATIAVDDSYTCVDCGWTGRR